LEDYLVEASKLLEKARSLSPEERRVLAYFAENISVGELRAVKELRYIGISNPLQVIRKLVGMGLLEEGEECFNLAKPLRLYISKRGKHVLLQELRR